MDKQKEKQARNSKFEELKKSLELEGKNYTLARIVFKIAWSTSRKYHLNQQP
jgi:hypothetical protein